MNSRIALTLFSRFSAALVTIAILAGVNGLATSQPSAAQLAHVTGPSASV